MKLFNQNSPIVNKAIEFAKAEYQNNDSFHGWGHIEDVMKRASEIVEAMKGNVDYELLRLAIIFHDIDYHSEETFEENYKSHVDNSTRVAEAFLKENNYPRERIERVKQIMFDHSTPHRKERGEAKSIEGKIIYDSDKSIFITSLELYERYFSLLYLDETKGMVKNTKWK